MKTLAAAFVLATLVVCAAAARAQEEREDGFLAAAPPPSDAPVVDMARYCNRHSVRRRRVLYPSRAQWNDIEGRVTVDCALNDEGRPSHCQVVSEAPVGWGFGEATLVAVCRSPPPRRGFYMRDGQRRHQKTVHWDTRRPSPESSDTGDD
jgi:TonB family protein